MRPLAAFLLTLAACTTTPTAQPAPPKVVAKPLRDARGMARIDGPSMAYAAAMVTTTTEPPVQPAVASEPVTFQPSSILARIAECESGGSYTARNPTSTASGKYQFLDSTWRAWGDGSASRAYLASPASQEAAARRLFAAMGTKPWNASRHCWAA